MISTFGRVSAVQAGGTTRFVPLKAKGYARSENTGSVRTLTPLCRKKQRGIPDKGHIPAIHIGRRDLCRLDQRHPVLFGRVVIVGQEGTSKAKSVEQSLVVAIACRMLEPVPVFVILRRIGVGRHGTASCQKKSGDKQRDKETHEGRHMANPGIG